MVTATTLNTFTSNWRRNHETVVSGHMALFGTLKDVQMRQRRNGHVFFVTSMGGLRTFPGLSAYHGSKFALEGIAATIAQEVAPFGIHVTAVESSSFRTDWAGRSMTRVRRTITDTSYSAATPFVSSPRHEPSLTRKQRGGRSCRYPRTTRPDGRSRARRERDDCRCARTDRVSTRTTARGRGRPRHRADSQPGSRYRGQPDGSSSRPVRPRARSSDSSRSMAASSASRFMPRRWACSLSVSHWTPDTARPSASVLSRRRSDPVPPALRTSD